MPFLSSLLLGEFDSTTGSDNEVNWECFGWESTFGREHCHGNHKRTEILFWALSNIHLSHLTSCRGAAVWPLECLQTVTEHCTEQFRVQDQEILNSVYKIREHQTVEVSAFSVDRYMQTV